MKVFALMLLVLEKINYAFKGMKLIRVSFSLKEMILLEKGLQLLAQVLALNSKHLQRLWLEKRLILAV